MNSARSAGKQGFPSDVPRHHPRHRGPGDPARSSSERSSPENGYYFWAYTIEITNRGPATVQLKTRHWKITDAHGKLQEVRGAGVVGETPTLEPGESFEYTSGVPLPTPSGFMRGSYGMVTANGEDFDIEIPAFSLDSAQSKPTLN